MSTYKNLVMYSSEGIPPNPPPLPVPDCPFCGATAIAASWTEQLDEFEIFAADVSCHDCGATVESDGGDIFDRISVVINAIQRWARRV